jgi:hypothetical protein
VSKHVVFFIPRESWFVRHAIPPFFNWIPLINLLVPLYEDAVSEIEHPPLTVTIAETSGGCHVTFSGWARRVLIERLEAALAASGVVATHPGEPISLERLTGAHDRATQRVPMSPDIARRKRMGILRRTVHDLKESSWWVRLAIVVGLIVIVGFFFGM